MKQDTENDDLPDNDPDLIENSRLSKLYKSSLRRALFTRFSDFDGMSYVEMLRQPGINGRIIKAIEAERTRLAAE